jgi:hypothetical protein
VVSLSRKIKKNFYSDIVLPTGDTDVRHLHWAQFPLEQLLHEEPEDREGAVSPWPDVPGTDVLWENVLKSFLICSPPQSGQGMSSSVDLTRNSKRFPHSMHSYS